MTKFTLSVFVCVCVGFFLDFVVVVVLISLFRFLGFCLCFVIVSSSGYELALNLKGVWEGKHLMFVCVCVCVYKCSFFFLLFFCSHICNNYYGSFDWTVEPTY
jgi:hypothetical protein